MRLLLACVAAASTLCASDTWIGQREQPRHAQMLEFFQKEPEERLSWWERPYMTGDWGEMRRDLASKGITICSSFVTDVQTNPRGGRRQGAAYAGSYGASLNIDFTGAGVKGLELLAAACWRTGTNLSRIIDAQFRVAQVFGSETVRLADLYLLQSLFHKKVILKAGRITPGDNFLVSDCFGRFLNKTLNGRPGSIPHNVFLSSYPLAVWGGYASILPIPELSCRFGVYNANLNVLRNKYHGVNFSFSQGREGLLCITEWEALINQRQESRGMPGNYKVGLYYLTGKKERFSGGTKKGDPGLYILLDQMVYRPTHAAAGVGLTPFLSLVFQPPAYNRFPFFVNGGLIYQGLTATRPKDALAFGAAYAPYSKDLVRAERKSHLPTQTAETVLELSYWVEVNPWCKLTPDLQYIIRPRGLKVPNTFVVGFQLSLENW